MNFQLQTRTDYSLLSFGDFIDSSTLLQSDATEFPNGFKMRAKLQNSFAVIAVSVYALICETNSGKYEIGFFRLPKARATAACDIFQ